jgi:hypothetical protein
VPIDLSVLYTRHPEIVRSAFSLVPDYLRTPEDAVAPNLMDYGVSLGRRFRALKLWMVLRAFGTEGIAERIREHLRLAAALRSWIETDHDFEIVAPSRFSLVCFRRAGSDVANEALLELNVVTATYLIHRLLPAMIRRGGRSATSSAGGWRFAWSALLDAASIVIPGHPRHGRHYRRAGDLRNALLAAGFSVTDRAVARASSPAWVLLEASRRPAVMARS